MKGTADATAERSAVTLLVVVHGADTVKPLKKRKDERANTTANPMATYSAMTAGEDIIYLPSTSKERGNTIAPMIRRKMIIAADAILYTVTN